MSAGQLLSDAASNAAQLAPGTRVVAQLDDTTMREAVIEASDQAAATCECVADDGSAFTAKVGGNYPGAI